MWDFSLSSIMNQVKVQPLMPLTVPKTTNTTTSNMSGNNMTDCETADQLKVDGTSEPAGNSNDPPKEQDNVIGNSYKYDTGDFTKMGRSVVNGNEDEAGERSGPAACFKPCLAESHPLDSDANFCARFKHNFLCPPHSTAGAILFVLVLSATGWATLLAITGDSALPGGNLFSLYVLFMACWCGGYLADCLRLPPLLGMLLVGGMLGNTPGVAVAKDIISSWSSGCRQIALTIILIRAGLGLDPQALRRLSCVVLRLAFMPCLAETITDGVASHLILGFPWPWAFMLGFVIAAVSPAVVVPSLLGLSEKGYGLDKGIPTLVIAAASVDDVLAITGFGVMLGISFSSGDIAWTLAKGPLEALAGVSVGTLGGLVLWYLPQRTSKHLVLFRSSLLMCLGLMGIFGSRRLGWSGAGPLAALTLSFVAAFRWRSEVKDGDKNPVDDVVGILWMLFQPLLFGLIGAEVDVGTLDGDTLGLGLSVLGIGLSVRMVISFLSVLGTDLNLRERIFIPIAWLPKATVQAAIGAVALDTANANNNPDQQDLGKQVLNIAVLSILVTAPVGSLLISLLGPALLSRSHSSRDPADPQSNSVPKGIEGDLTPDLTVKDEEGGQA